MHGCPQGGADVRGRRERRAELGLEEALDHDSVLGVPLLERCDHSYRDRVIHSVTVTRYRSPYLTECAIRSSCGSPAHRDLPLLVSRSGPSLGQRELVPTASR